MHNDVGHSYYALEPILRMTLSITIFHFISLIIMLPRSNLSEVWHDGFWTIKFVIIIGLWILLFSISNQTLRIWLKVALFGAFTFCCFIITMVVFGILKLSQVIYLKSIKVRNFVHYLVYFINSITLLLILTSFFMFISGGSLTAAD